MSEKNQSNEQGAASAFHPDEATLYRNWHKDSYIQVPAKVIKVGSKRVKIEFFSLSYKATIQRYVDPKNLQSRSAIADITHEQPQAEGMDALIAERDALRAENERLRGILVATMRNLEQIPSPIDPHQTRFVTETIDLIYSRIDFTLDDWRTDARQEGE